MHRNSSYAPADSLAVNHFREQSVLFLAHGNRLKNVGTELIDQIRTSPSVVDYDRNVGRKLLDEGIGNTLVLVFTAIPRASNPWMVTQCDHFGVKWRRAPAGL
jgi:hypothetical protein